MRVDASRETCYNGYVMEESNQQAEARTSSGREWLYALLVLALGVAVAFFVYTTTTHTDSRYPFKLGLDLAGGSHLVYEADVSALPEEEVPDAMSTLRDVIERRVNVFGVSEPLVQVEESSRVVGEVRQRLVVELPGVTDVDAAVAAIGQTPLLEFKLVNPDAALGDLTAMIASRMASSSPESSEAVALSAASSTAMSDRYQDTGLTGRYLERASLEFGASQGGLSNEPVVQVTFSDEGAELFAEITRVHVGEQLAIFLDGVSLSEPVIRQPITGGTAVISGDFTPEEARELVRNLNFGALPVPIELASMQTVGASLGADILEHGVAAGLVGLGLVISFMCLWYRLPGLVAAVSLATYVALMLALFKLIPVTLTAAGLAGLVLSVGMAVDANVLVFGRMQEEYRSGKDSRTAAREGFRRAWTAIRDGNATSVLSAVVLFWFGTSLVKGFALVFGMGVLISMLTAITVTRTLLVALPVRTRAEGGVLARLYESGIDTTRNT